MKRHRRIIETALLFALLNVTSVPPGTAQPSGSSYYKKTLDKGAVGTQTGRTGSIHYEEPPDKGPPAGTTTGGGFKGDCPATHLRLAALVPTSAWGQTVNQHPTFWFYVPYASSADFPATFVLQDPNGTEIYRTIVSLPEVAGIVSVQIPSDKQLKANKRYDWFFQVKCSTPALAVSGQIQRIELTPELKQQIKAANPHQQAILYAQNGVWFDALNILAGLHRANPQDPTITADWVALLGQVQLQEIATQPIAK